MQFTQSELIAIAKMALDISKADGLRHQKETDAIMSELRRFGVAFEDCSTILVHALNLSFDASVRTISSFSPEEKKYVAAYLGALICVDENVTESEMRLWQTISNRCDLPSMSLYDATQIMLSFSKSSADIKIEQHKDSYRHPNCSWEEFKRKKEEEAEEKRRRQLQREAEERRKAEERRIAKEREERILQLKIEAGKIKKKIEKECSIACLTPCIIIMIILLLLSFAIPFMLIPAFIWAVIGGIWAVFKCYIDIDKKKQEWKDNHPNDPIGSYL